MNKNVIDKEVANMGMSQNRWYLIIFVAWTEFCQCSYIVTWSWFYLIHLGHSAVS